MKVIMSSLVITGVVEALSRIFSWRRDCVAAEGPSLTVNSTDRLPCMVGVPVIVTSAVASKLKPSGRSPATNTAEALALPSTTTLKPKELKFCLQLLELLLTTTGEAKGKELSVWAATTTNLVEA